ncbi:hypothetical protein EC9_23230 [Rosistilla ulvae]|uniref:Carboxypeptidase regulatory-like domain-containing protein n=1 Tax=Rosistilla ulvae TaxID=1930277 RepID=A0A517LZT4_9BACT|nr:carboxypeptidase-like regulatory domain-containing protein [Rosistilla ulvae]QDS88136.1 hypothetical protein EC9_23230 [Rosistilla ulvae]
MQSTSKLNTQLTGVSWSAALCGLLLAAIGCSGEVGPVEAGGQVTMSSSPLANANVVFSPIGGGIAAQGTTDAQGTFELVSADGTHGVMPGEYQVSISTYRRGDPRENIADSAETVPAKYNEQSTMREHVSVDAENQFQFELVP